MEILESVIFESIPEDRIDEENGVIQGVRVLGAISRNNRRYTEQAMREAVGLYEGRGVKLDHPDRDRPNKDRSVLEGFGELRSVRYDPREQAIYADHHFPKKHRFAEAYLDNCKRFPKQLGFSHNAEGEFKMSNGTQIVEAINDVYSVDLVDSPATNKGIFESEDKSVKKKTIKEVLEDSSESTLGTRAVLLEGLANGNIQAEIEVDLVESETPDESITQALRAGILSIFEQEQDADKIATCLVALLGEPPSPGDTDTIESLQRQLDDMVAENDVRRLLESSHVSVDDDLVEALKPLNKNQRQALIARIERQATTPRPTRPARSAPVSESVSTDYEKRWTKALEESKS